jgi:hypothetical protein
MVEGYGKNGRNAFEPGSWGCHRDECGTVVAGFEGTLYGRVLRVELRCKVVIQGKEDGLHFYLGIARGGGVCDHQINYCVAEWMASSTGSAWPFAEFWVGSRANMVGFELVEVGLVDDAFSIERLFIVRFQKANPDA